MNLKDLIKEVERLNKWDDNDNDKNEDNNNQLQGIKQTVEAEEPLIKKAWDNMTFNEREEYKTLKKLLGIK